MSHKAHPDCPSCACHRPDDGEEMRVFVNGFLLQEGETRTVKTGDQITYSFIKTVDALEAQR